MLNISIQRCISYKIANKLKNEVNQIIRIELFTVSNKYTVSTNIYCHTEIYYSLLIYFLPSCVPPANENVLLGGREDTGSKAASRWIPWFIIDLEILSQPHQCKRAMSCVQYPSHCTLNYIAWESEGTPHYFTSLFGAALE